VQSTPMRLWNIVGLVLGSLLAQPVRAKGLLLAAAGAIALVALMGVGTGLSALRYASLRAPFVLHAVNNLFLCAESVFPEVFQRL
jgi:hypothetical protein